MARTDRQPLPDQAERDAAVHQIDTSMCVEASAGTGKTTVLVGRIMDLLCSGKADLDGIVAITFTEKAAGELKVRLREEIEKAIPRATGELQGRLATALTRVDRAQVSTIHSFAAALLRERPVEAGIDPGFEQLDELGARMLLDELWEEWLAEQMQGDCPPLAAALQAGVALGSTGPTSYSARALAEDLVTNRDLLADATVPRPDVEPRRLVDQYQALVAELEQLAERCNDPEDGCYAEIRKLVRHAASPPERGGEVGFLLRVPSVKGSAGNQRNWASADACRRAKDTIKQIRALLAPLNEIVLADLVDWLRGFIERYQEEKRARGCVDFTDLLIEARNLLRDSREVRRYFQRKFQYLLVDEFQDTDPLQVEIVFFLAEDGTDADRWSDVRLAPGKLFIVGDPKQSIYRFRRADVAMYESAKRHLSSRGKLSRISTNFRSAPGIIRWVNGVFSQLIGGGQADKHQAAYVPLVENRGASENRPAVCLVKPEIEGELLADEQRDVEARCIGDMIQRAVEGEKWLVWDKPSGRAVPAEYRHVAVLMPRRTSLEVYEDALQLYRVPYRVESGRSFYFRPEVFDLTAVLRAIDSPDDPAAVVGALRTPFFALSDEDLFRFKTAGSEFSFLKPVEEKWDRFADSFGILRELHDKRHELPLHRLIDELFDRTRAMVFYRLKPHGHQAVANLLKVADQARAMDAAGGITLRWFVRWVEAREDEAAPESDSPTAEPKDNFVQLLTMHKAKGLEFPIVILANMGTRLQQRGGVVFDREGRRMAVSFSAAMQTHGADVLREAEQAQLEAEERRLLYVAATRARDYLVLPALPCREKTYAHHLEDLADNFGAETVRFALRDLRDPADLDRRARTDALKPSKADEDARRARTQWIAAQQQAIERASQGVRINRASPEKPEHEAEPVGEPSLGAQIGSAVHAVMEQVDLSESEAPEGLIRAAAIENGIEDRADELAGLVRACLASDPVRRAGAASWLAREMGFCIPFEGGFAEGKIDLIFEHGGKLTIVDYKTDAVAGAGIDLRLQEHRRQGAVYAAAVRKATGRSVDEAVFVFARAAETRSLPGAELEAEGAAALGNAEEEQPRRRRDADERN